ncbi:MAG: heavy metal translocating P-type ATPase, partial [Burkholderiales bacterium]|nr:heavy metal translocating P-type ATPase [Burkholderiales bacterium]
MEQEGLPPDPAARCAPVPDAVTLLDIPDMCCAAEFGTVDNALRRIAGVGEVTPDFIRRTVRVQHRSVPAAELVDAAARTGFAVRLADAPKAAMRGRGLAAIGIRAEAGAPVANACVEPGPGGTPMAAPMTPSVAASVAAPAAPAGHWKLIAGGLLAVAAEGAALAFGDRALAVVALAAAAIGLAGLDTYRQGLLALRRGNLNINALMTVAVTGAAVLGQWPEAAMVMVLFAVAEMIEDKSLDRARRAVEGLMAMAPETATVQEGTAWREVPAAGLAPGALVRVRPGERIALDGRVTAGASAVDQAAITGESVPVDKAVGDPLFAGTINRDGELQYRVTAGAGDSTLARIIRAVQEAQGTRAPTQRFVDAFARYYTPAVFAGAVLVALAPPLLMGGAWFTWVYRALVLLVIACPCALVLSTPISIVSGLTAAARRGILIKGGLFLEQGHRLQVLALDKTGTLTQGRPVVTTLIALQGSEAEALRLAGALASRSDHPVSRAVAQRAAGDAVAAGAAAGAALTVTD